MRELGDERLSRNFAGSLLVAHPNMADPNFRRTVLFGGPVGKNQLMFAAFEWKKGAGLKLNHNVAFDEPSDPHGHKNLLTVCAFVGYAGWGAGQLESEVKQKAWVVQKANPSLLKLDRLPNLWFDIMRTLGPWYKMLAAAPDDPSLN